MTDVITSIQTLTSAVQGPPGPPGTGVAITAAFTYETTDGLTLYTATDCLIYRVEVIVVSPFDGGMTLTIGDGDDNARLVQAADVKLSERGCNQINCQVAYTTATAIKLYLTPTGSVTTGNGIILIYQE